MMIKRIIGLFIIMLILLQMFQQAETDSEAQQVAKPAAKSSDTVSKLGEMLVSKGILSEVDLMKALAASKRKNVPIGSTFI